MRRFIMLLGLVLLIGGGLSYWRATHPVLSPQQQIAANLDDVASALQSRAANRVLSHLAPEFSWNNSSRKEIGDILRGSLLGFRDVQLQRSGETVQVQGDTATSSGSFRLSYRSSQGGQPQTQSGEYSLQWRKIDGEWKITSAKGGESVGG